MTSIIMAALGVAGWLFAFWYRLSWHRAVDLNHDLTLENVNQDEGVGLLLDRIAELETTIARLTPLAGIGERRIQAYRKYKAKRKGNGDA